MASQVAHARQRVPGAQQAVRQRHAHAALELHIRRRWIGRVDAQQLEGALAASGMPRRVRLHSMKRSLVQAALPLAGVALSKVHWSMPRVWTLLIGPLLGLMLVAACGPSNTQPPSATPASAPTVAPATVAAPPAPAPTSPPARSATAPVTGEVVVFAASSLTD